MREHKYKIWDKEKKEMIMPCDIPFEIDCNIQEFLEIILGGCSDRYFPLQYTGLKGLWEGDIVKTMSGDIGVIEWDAIDACFSIVGNAWSTNCLMSNEEVIGNIYQNPEILKNIKE